MSVSYDVTGTGDPVVLLHGSMASKEQWRMLLRDLVPQFTVITMDLSGYGKSPPPADPDQYALKHESDLLNSVLDQVLDADMTYHLLGHSYGGAVALHHAYHYPHRVSSLTAIEPMAYHLLPKDHAMLTTSQNMIEEIKGDIEKGENLAGARRFIDLWMRPGTFDNLSDREKSALGNGVKKLVCDFQAAVNDPLSLTDYASLPMPICLIAGKESHPFSLSISQSLHQAIPKISMQWVEGGHFSIFTHGHQVNPIVLQFIDQYSSTA